MSTRKCDICQSRLATRQFAGSDNGKPKVWRVCQEDFTALTNKAKRRSPLENLFAGNLLDNLLAEVKLDDITGLVNRATQKVKDAFSLNRYFSDQTREIIQIAAQKAFANGKSEVDTEYVLYTLCANEVAREILKRSNIEPDDLRGYIEQNYWHGANNRGAEQFTEMTLSPRLKAAIELGFGAARELGHGYIGPEHLLVGLILEEDGLAGQVMRKFGLTPGDVRQQVTQVVGRGPNTPISNTPRLDKVSRDLTALAHKGKLDPVIGRAQEIETTIEILARRKKNNPVLIGEPGVGKTAIVEGLAQRIVNEEVPEVLRNKRVIELNLNSLVAGSQFRGQFEERVKGILDEILKYQDQLLIFVDEVHTIIGAGQAGEGSLDVANTFKPAMARGELHLIGATTLNEYQKYIEKDAALERRFQPILIMEPTVEQTINILRGLRDRLEAHHKVALSDDAIIAAAELSDRYITNRFLPDKAIDLLDQAASRVRINVTSRPPEIHDVQSEINQLEREHEYALSRKQTSKAQELQQAITAQTEILNALLEKWKSSVGSGNAEVRLENIAEVVSKLTGIPVTELTEEERGRLINLERRLHERVVGQEDAVRIVSDAVRLARVGLKDRSRPTANLLFLGPSGVGKTELAKALAEVVFGDEDAIVRLDMSEYSERQSTSRLIGSPPGYIGYDEGGQLTERVRRHPYSVVLLDEIEKANPEVYNLLLQVFDEGRLTDAKGRQIDFTHAIIIATSNLGQEYIRGSVDNDGHIADYERLSEQLANTVRQHFPAEFINRIDDTVIFHPLTREEIARIVQMQLEKLGRNAQAQGITVSFDPSVVSYISQVGYHPQYGARELKRKIRSEIETKLAAAMLRNQVNPGDAALILYSLETRQVQVINPASQGSGDQDSPDHKLSA